VHLRYLETTQHVGARGEAGSRRNVAQSTGAIKNAGGGHVDFMTVEVVSSSSEQNLIKRRTGDVLSWPDFPRYRGNISPHRQKSRMALSKRVSGLCIG